MFLLCKTAAVFLLCVKRERALEKTGSVNNVTILSKEMSAVASS